MCGQVGTVGAKQSQLFYVVQMKCELSGSNELW